MPKPVRIALDAMGGDHGPGVVVSGAALALEKHSQVAFLIYGEEALVRPLIEASPKLAARTTFVHTSVAVKMGDKPSQALRAGRRTSSMWLAIEAVKRGEADVAVSAGNTGALMAMAKFCLHTMALIDRPAIAAVWPTIRGEIDRSRCRRDDRRRCAPSRRSRHHGRGHGDGPVRSRTPDRRPAQYRRRGDQGQRGRQGGGPPAARNGACRR